MKRVILICLLGALFCLSGTAQTIRYGVVAGVNYTMPEKLTARFGAQLGAKAEFDFASTHSEGWYGDAEVLLSLQRWTAHIGIDKLAKTNRRDFSPIYLKVPVHLGYRFKLGERNSMFIAAGPYVALGLFGNMKSKRVLLDGKVERDTWHNVFKGRFRDGERPQERFDWGVSTRVGADFGDHFQVVLGFDKGLKPFNSIIRLSRNDVFSLSCGYMF